MKPSAVDQILQTLDQQLGLLFHLRPLNVPEERARFFASESYEPQFLYRPMKIDIAALETSLRGLEIDRHEAIGELLEKKRGELIRRCRLLRARGNDEEFPKASDEFFGKIPDWILEAANEELKGLPLRNMATGIPGVLPKIPMAWLSKEQVIARFEEELQKRGLSRWRVKAHRHIVARCCIGKNQTIFVHQDEKFTERSLQRLIAHEIETHVYCSENGKLQPYRIFQQGTAGYLKTQEGLAFFHQHRKCPEKLSIALLRLHAAVLGRFCGFREVVNELCRYCPKSKAWKVVLGLKRGLSDTGKSGVFLRSAMYYWGFKEVENYVNGGGPWADLFLGKFALEDLPLIKKINGVVPPRFVPECPSMQLTGEPRGLMMGAASKPLNPPVCASAL